MKQGMWRDKKKVKNESGDYTVTQKKKKQTSHIFLVLAWPEAHER